MNKYTSLLFTKKLSRGKPEITLAQFKELAIYTNGFLKENVNRLAGQKNESGLVRINVPPTKNIKSQFNGIEIIQLNYWPPSNGITACPETIHTHPYCFESYIVKGGYTHSVYAYDNKNDTAYSLYRIVEENGNKSFAFADQIKLKFVQNESVKENKIVAFNKELIHKIIYTKPETVSLDVIFGNATCDGRGYYNIYLNKDDSLAAFEKTEQMVSNDTLRPFIQAMIHYLSKVK